MAGFWAGVLASGWGKEGVVAPAEAGQSGDWCAWLKDSPGTLYKNPENPVIQELKVFSRFHFNYAWVDGEAGGRDFWYSNRGEIRRFWPGVTAKLADGALTAHYEMMIEDDARPKGGDRDLSYNASWTTYLEWELGKTFPNIGSGSWWVGYGKRPMPLAEEVLDSSKFMPVVERSAISNRLFALTTSNSSPLGGWIRHKAGRWSSLAGCYSTDSAPYWGDWHDGTAWVVQTERDISDLTGTDAALLAAACYYDDTGRGDERLSGGLNWTASAWTIIKEGLWTYRANLIFGEADSTNPLQDGSIWGFVGTVQRELIEGRLEAVGRYHYQGAQNPQGIQLYSRYARTAGQPQNEAIPTLAGGRGDDQHAIYLGLNWKLCGDNIKLMSGVEWERLRSQSSEVYEGITYWLGLRTFF